MRQLGFNSLWLALARVGAQALSVAFNVLLARRLGEAGFGEYAWLAAMVAIGNAVTTFGTDTLIIRELARDDQTTPGLLGAAIWLQLGLSGLWLLAVWWINGAGLLFWFSLALLPLSVYSPFSAALRAHERMQSFAWLNLLGAALPVLAVWGSVQSRADLFALAGVVVATQLIGALLAAWLCARAAPRFAVTWRWDGTVLLAVLRAALPFALLMAATLLYQRLGVLALTALAGQAETGWYSAAARVVEGLKLGHYAVLGALLPRATRAPDSTQNRLALLLLITSITLALAMTLFAGPVIGLLFGARYQPASEVLRVLAWMLVPYSLSAYLSVMLVARNTEYLLLLGTLLALAVSVALHLWLIPLWGAIGAGWAMVLSECALAGMLFVLNRKTETPHRGVSTLS